jgi:glycosyltransferase involved in cell wall biosynthesis
MVKNEADIIGASLAHAFEQGVCHMLISDNGSTDGTVELLHELASTYPLTIATDSMLAYEQASKMTHLARAASRHGATWVVPMDADEFWTAPEGSVASHLEASPVDIEVATLRNIFPLVDLPVVDRTSQFRIETVASFFKKVAVRASRSLWIDMGNHRAVRGTIRSDSGLQVFHLPWRSFDQFSRKVTQGRVALEQTDYEENIGFHWRKLGAEPNDRLRARWDSLLQAGHGPELFGTPLGTWEVGRPLLPTPRS